MIGVLADAGSLDLVVVPALLLVGGPVVLVTGVALWRMRQQRRALRVLEAIARERGGTLIVGESAVMVDRTLAAIRASVGETIVVLEYRLHRNGPDRVYARARFVDPSSPAFTVTRKDVFDDLVGGSSVVVGALAAFDERFVVRAPDPAAARLAWSHAACERMRQFQGVFPRVSSVGGVVELTFLGHPTTIEANASPAIDLVADLARCGSEVRERLRSLPGARALDPRSTEQNGLPIVELDTPHGPVRMRRADPLLPPTVVAWAMLQRTIHPFVARIDARGGVSGDVPEGALAGVAHALAEVGEAKLGVEGRMVTLTLDADASDVRMLAACRAVAAIAAAPHGSAFR